MSLRDRPPAAAAFACAARLGLRLRQVVRPMTQPGRAVRSSSLLALLAGPDRRSIGRSPLVVRRVLRSPTLLPTLVRGLSGILSSGCERRMPWRNSPTTGPTSSDAIGPGSSRSPRPPTSPKSSGTWPNSSLSLASTRSTGPKPAVSSVAISAPPARSSKPWPWTPWYAWPQPPQPGELKPGGSWTPPALPYTRRFELEPDGSGRPFASRAGVQRPEYRLTRSRLSHRFA